MTDLIAHLSTALADRYRIERKLGEGGMATVYLADDVKHDRRVALKVLRPELAVVIGADRFLQEIKTTARLQHPHILPLYDSGRVAAAPGGPEFLYYVMPYIDGETLRQKLEREQQLSIDDAVRITSEVADALHYAHEQGVIHRDIKPENILLRDGRAYVADFGIALAVSTAAGGRMTETGLSMGTPHYMSPEQATADTHITGRSDIYALGAVLYELLTGEPPHSGPSTPMIIMKIVSDVARPVRELRKTVPANVAAAVATALEKLPADRFDNAKAFNDALHNPSYSGSVVAAATLPATAPASRRPLYALSSALVLMTAVAAWAWTRGSSAATVARYQTSLGTVGKLDGMALATQVALSPDGASLVFRSPLFGPGQLYIKRRDEVEARPLTGTEDGSGPFFSHDGAWIGFVANGQMRRVPSGGGASIKIADSVNATFNRGAWLEDGSIVYYDFELHALRQFREGDAKSKVIVSPAMLSGRYPWLPSPLPNSRGVLFTAHQTLCVGPVSCRPSKVYVYDARKDSIRAVFDDAIGAWYVPTGHVLYLTSAGLLMAAPWDNDALAPTGKAVAVLDGIQAPGFQIANDGTAIYTVGRPEFAPGPVPNARVVWVDRTGRIEPVDTTWQVNTGGTDNGAMGYDWGVALSPDGKRIALSMLTDVGTDVWIKQLPSGPATRLTMYDGIDRVPAFTPDGRSVTFLSDRPTVAGQKSHGFSVWEQAVDGTGEPRLLWSKDAVINAFRSPDGKYLLMGANASPSSLELRVARPGIDSASLPVSAAGVNAGGATLSPDSRWIAYVSSEQGSNEVFVRPFPDVNGPKWQVSKGGGTAPIWSHSGRELFYFVNGKMHVVRIASTSPFAADPPRVLFALGDSIRAGSVRSGTFTISPDDQRFLMVLDNNWSEMAGTPTLVAVQGFLQELRQKLKQ